MPDREAELGALVERLREVDGVSDAWTAKSFTDRLVVVTVPEDGALPDGVRDRLAAHDCRGADEVYDVPGAGDPAFAGELDGEVRYRFVDVATRGEMQSYVVDS